MYISLSLLLILIIIGVLGYTFIDGYGFTDSFYMTIITIATVGFGEPAPLSLAGKWFTVVLILFSFGTFAYALTSLTSLLADGTFSKYLRNKMIRKKVNELKDHVIVCGYGNNGLQVVLELQEHGVPFVIVDKDSAVIELINEDERLLWVEGDATQDDVLHEAGIKHAKALIATLPDDSHNVFLVLTARQLNTNLTIISRASDEGSDIKLRRAGANSVIMPDKIGGRRMARLIAQPDVVQFVEYVMSASSDNVIIDEVKCNSITDYFNGRTLRDIEKHNDSGVMILGIKQADKIFIINPLTETSINSHDKLFVLGTRRQINNFRKILSDYSIKD